MPVSTQENGEIASVDALAAKLAQTSLYDEGAELLAGLRLSAASRKTTPQHLRNVLPIPTLLPWLGNSDLVDDVCSLISFTLSDLDGDALLPFRPLIEQGLAGNIGQVITLCLEEAQKLLLPDFLPLIWDTVGFEDLLVADKASKLLERYARSPAVASAIYAPESLRVMEDLYERNEIVKYRLFDTVARISSTSEEAFKASVDTGLPARLKDELDFEADMLGALGALELCAQLVLTTPQGLAFLEHLGIPSAMAETLSGSHEELVTSNIVKFFGQIGTAMDENSGIEATFLAHGVLDRVQKLMDEPTATLESSLFVFMENLGSTHRGQALLKEQSRLVASFLYNYRSASTEGRLVALHAISVLIDHCPPELVSFAQQIYEDLGRNPPKDLVQLCRSALEESRVAGYSVIKALVRHPWGLRALINSSDVQGWLFDRRTDPTTKGMEWKYSIIQGMLESPAAGEVVPEEFKARLQRYVNEGPFFKPTEAHVAFLSS